MRKSTLRLVGILLLITALIVSQIPAETVFAETVSNPADFYMSGKQVVKYVGSATTIIIPDEATSIGENAFAGNTMMTSVQIPESVVSIADSAFSNCTNLKDVTIKGTGLTDLGNGVFAGCEKLASVSFAKGARYLCENGTIYKSDYSVLIEVLLGSGRKQLSMSSKVEEIRPFACWGCTALTGVTFPLNVVTIPAYSFAGCTGLKNVEFPVRVRYIDMRAFQDCINLEQVSYAGAPTVHETAFEGCVKLYGDASDVDAIEYEDTGTSGVVAIHGSVSDFDEDVSGNEAVEDASEESGTSDRKTESSDGEYAIIMRASGETLATTKIVGNKAVLFIDNSRQKVRDANSTSNNRVVIEDGVLQQSANHDDIVVNTTPAVNTVDGSSGTGEQTGADGNSASLSGSALITSDEEVAVSDNIDAINHALNGDADDKGFVLPKYTIYRNQVVHQAYYRDEELTSFEIPEGVTSIGDFAFARSSLSQVTIPNSVTSIGYAAFYHCGNLADITIPSTVTKIERYALDYTAYMMNWKADRNSDYLILGDGILVAYKGMDSRVTIPEGVKHIGAGAFAGLETFTSVIMPSSLISIEENAFEDCSNLVTVQLNDGLVKIADRAFAGCPVQNPIIPASVKYMGLGCLDKDADSALFTPVGNTITFLGTDLPTVISEKSSQRLSSSSERTYAIRNYPYAVITEAAAQKDQKGTIADADMPGYFGVFFTKDDPSHTLTPVSEISRGTNVVPLPSYVTIDGYNYKIASTTYQSDASALSGRKKDDSQGNVRVVNSSTYLNGQTITAKIEGSTENFVLHISDSFDAANVISVGYTSAYGSEVPSNLIPLDMVLYDETDTIPIVKLGKQKIEISFDLPERLFVNGTVHIVTADEEGQLEEVSYKTDIDANPIRLTLSTDHFSPVGVYVYTNGGSADTAVMRAQKLVFHDGNAKLDESPATGDRSIHPKWFVVMGCVLLAIVCFLWKPKTYKRKATA